MQSANLNQAHLCVRTLISSVLALGMVFAPMPASAIDFDEYPQVRELVDEIVQQHGLDREWVTAVISDAEFREDIIKLITRPAESFPWYRYRKLFVTESNTQAGVAFWTRYKDILARAEQEFGVDAQYIVAIIGVETRFGKITGRHRIIDSLMTLTLGYPRRSEFFKREFIEFLKLSRNEGLNPYHTKGSYAGAMGIPQFISSSYSNYAVDFNGNGKRDLLREPADAIGSVGNYLSEHGWKRGDPVFVDLNVKEGADISSYKATGLATNTTFGELRKAGASAVSGVKVSNNQALGLVILETSEGEFLNRGGFPNFYVITKYNRSNLYASAVAELAAMLKRAGPDL